MQSVPLGIDKNFNDVEKGWVYYSGESGDQQALYSVIGTELDTAITYLAAKIKTI